MKKFAIFLFSVIFLINNLTNSVFAEKLPKGKSGSFNYQLLLENIIKRFALIKTDSNLLPALIFGKNYVIVPASSIYEENSNSKLLKKFVVSYEGREYSQVKVVIDYKGIVLLEVISFQSNLPFLTLAPLEGWNQKVYYTQFFLYKSGAALKSLLLVEEAKVAAISNGLFFIDKGFFGVFYGIGVFNEKGELVGIAVDNMAVIFEGTNFSVPKYGMVASAQVFSHFNLAIKQK